MTMDVRDSPGISVLLPPRVFLACLLGGALGDFLLPDDVTPLGAIPLPARLVAGAAIAGGGFAFMMWGHDRFRTFGTAVKTCEPATELVTGGAFRFSRNPMYVGFVAILLGIGAATGSLPTVVAAGLMFLFLDRYVVPREESYLLRRFGEGYANYRRRARRWL